MYQDKRVILFQIPATPQGIPIAYKGHYYDRDGESLVALNLQEIEKIRAQRVIECPVCNHPQSYFRLLTENY